MRSARSSPVVGVGADGGVERGAVVRDIAHRAGVGNATLHRHFPTRQALLSRGRQTGDIRADVPVRESLKLVNATGHGDGTRPNEQADRLLELLLDGLHTPAATAARSR